MHLKMLLLICVMYFLNCRFPVNGDVFSYQYITSDNISERGIIEEINDVANRIHCASACFENPACKGFGYGEEKDCLLFEIFVEQDHCSKESCQTREGMRMYMSKQDITTTTTSLPTTTTTTTSTTTTTEAATTTTTSIPTTTTVATTTAEQTTTSTTEEPTTTTTTAVPTTTTTMATTTTAEPTTTSTMATTTTAEPTTTTAEPTTTTTEPTTTTREFTTTARPTTTTTKPTTTTTAPTTTTAKPTTTTTIQPPTTTTTELPTTTEAPTSTEAPTTTTLKPTTTTTLKPTTTTVVVKKTVSVTCKNSDFLLRMFVSRGTFFNDDMGEIICYPFGNDIYTEKESVEKEFKPTEEGACDDDAQVITGLSFYTENSVLTSYKINCRKMKADHLSDKKREKVSTAFKSADCGEEAVPNSIKTKKMEEMGQIVYEIVLGCQGVEIPIPKGPMG